ncbi:hypothetical protein AVEN_154621-1 [Araneus ventricosus]|uniref:Uncharacterized protein n=1 Tax=Araneus ventricosus TaxID=182803 RepID=A0A4Y2JXR6_ARAVE|nr:hypothetical protein AVEN_154621-1 [Araneus ventricosus]
MIYRTTCLMHDALSGESGFEPGTLRPLSRDFTSGPLWPGSCAEFDDYASADITLRNGKKLHKRSAHQLPSSNFRRTPKTFALQGDPSRTTHTPSSKHSSYIVSPAGRDVTRNDLAHSWRIFSPNRDIEKIPAPLRSHISSPNLSPSPSGKSSFPSAFLFNPILPPTGEKFRKLHKSPVNPKVSSPSEPHLPALPCRALRMRLNYSQLFHLKSSPCADSPGSLVMFNELRPPPMTQGVGKKLWSLISWGSYTIASAVDEMLCMMQGPANWGGRMVALGPSTE